MADAVAVPSVAPADADGPKPSGVSLSLGNYQNWLMTSGHLPVDQILTQHPSKIAATTADRAKTLSDRWEGMLNSTASLFSDGSADATVHALRKDAHPGPARAAMTGEAFPITDVASGGALESGEPKSSVLGAAEQAASVIRESTAQTIEQQWRQTVAIIQHGLSQQIITAAIESSISASKEVNEGLDTLLRS